MTDCGESEIIEFSVAVTHLNCLAPRGTNHVSGCVVSFRPHIMKPQLGNRDHKTVCANRNRILSPSAHKLYYRRPTTADRTFIVSSVFPVIKCPITFADSVCKSKSNIVSNKELQRAVLASSTARE